MCRWLENEVLLLSMSSLEVKNLNEQILNFLFLHKLHQREPEGSPETELTLLLTSGLHLTLPFGLLSWHGYEDKTNEIAVRLILIT